MCLTSALETIPYSFGYLFEIIIIGFPVPDILLEIQNLW